MVIGFFMRGRGKGGVEAGRLFSGDWFLVEGARRYEGGVEAGRLIYGDWVLLRGRRARRGRGRGWPEIC